MSKPLSSNEQLIEQQDAVGMYLSALLSDEPQDKIDNEPNNNLEVTQKGNALDTQLDSLKNIDTELTQTYDITDKPLEQGIPEYLSNGFQSLSFIVSNIKLCVPLQQLNGIIEWNGKITRLPGQAKWCVGIMHIRGRNVNVVDLYSVLHNIPSNLWVNDELVKNSVPYVLLVGNGKWGLVCDSVDNISLLYKDDINWRTSGANELIMGTVLNHLSLILNADEIVRRLENSLL